MKKALIYSLIPLIFISLVGCSSNKEQEANSPTITNEKDKTKIQDKDGNEATISTVEWPSNDLAKLIPVYDGGKVQTSMESEESVWIILEETNIDQFDAYLEKVKKVFDVDPTLINTEDGKAFSATNSDGVAIILTYSSNGTTTITVSKEFN